ncbi:hypothetical protein SG34_012280 [Thalassomonas viridans]|uniref:Uncharacterized protein n=1 Tax=Thalassomonas viridans TaxID=137584 RepID=A0AAF0CCT9_9GAMM|nr:hypothetical protein [Thalassomonas viridans]WDE07589.1 hypothetical protein SG34_012280 [Thalassomonas viridans]
MKKIFIFLPFLAPDIAFSCPSLQGTWLSSLEKFESFNNRWANIDDRAWSFMEQTQGHEIIKFNDNNEMLVSTPEIEVKVGEKTMKLPPNEERINFSVLGCTDKSIALKYQRYGKMRISQLHFENDNTYWEYMGTSASDGNSHIREYYVKAE